MADLLEQANAWMAENGLEIDEEAAAQVTGMLGEGLQNIDPNADWFSDGDDETPTDGEVPTGEAPVSGEVPTGEAPSVGEEAPTEEYADPLPEAPWDNPEVVAQAEDGIIAAATDLPDPEDEEEEQSQIGSWARGNIRGVLGAASSMADLALDSLVYTHGADPERIKAIKQWTQFEDIVAPPTTLAGKLIEPLAQALTGFAGPGKFLLPMKMAGKTGAAVGMGRGAIADFTAFDETETRLSNLIQNWAGDDAPAIIDWMAAKEGDHWAAGRAKNAIEGAAIGGTVEVVMRLIGTGFRRLRLAQQKSTTTTKVSTPTSTTKIDITQPKPPTPDTLEGVAPLGPDTQVIKQPSETLGLMDTTIQPATPIEAARRLETKGAAPDPALAQVVEDYTAILQEPRTQQILEHIRNTASASKRQRSTIREGLIRAAAGPVKISTKDLDAATKMVHSVMMKGKKTLDDDATLRRFIMGDNQASKKAVVTFARIKKDLGKEFQNPEAIKAYLIELKKAAPISAKDAGVDETALARAQEALYRGMTGKATLEDDVVVAAFIKKDPILNPPTPARFKPEPDVQEAASDLKEIIEAGVRVLRSEALPEDAGLVRAFLHDEAAASAKTRLQLEDVSAPGVPEIGSSRAQANARVVAEKTSNVVGEETGARGTLGWSEADLQVYRNRMEKAKVGEIDWDEIGAGMPINLKHFSDDQVRLNLMALAEAATPQVRQNWDEVLTHKVVQKLAAKMGENPVVLMKALANAAETSDSIGVVAVAANNYLNAIADMLGTAGKKYLQGQASMDDLEPLITTALVTLDQVKRVTKGAGRVVNFSQIDRDPSAIQRQKITEALASLKETGNRERFFQTLAQVSKDPTALTRIGNWLVNRGPIRVLNEIWISAILSGPVTHRINVGSAAIRLATRPATAALGHSTAALFNAGLGRFKDAGQNLAGIRTELRTYTALRSAWRDSLRAAATTWKTEVNQLDNMGWMDGDTLTHAIHGLPGKLLRVPSRALQTEDEFFKQINYRARVQALAVDEGIKNGLSAKPTITLPDGKKVSDLDVFVEDKLRQAFDEDGRATNKEALEWARTSTFTTPLEAGSWGKWVQDRMQTHPELARLTPFVRTPVNILLTGWGHTPLVGLLGKRARAMMKTQAGRAELLGQQMVGAAILGTGYSLAMEGKITGSGPRDKDARAIWLKTHQPNSIKIGDKWYNHQMFEPYSTLLSLVGNLQEVYEELDEPRQEEVEAGTTYAIMATLFGDGSEALARPMDTAARSLLTVTRTVTDKSYFLGINDLLEVIEAGEDGGPRLSRWIGSQAAGNIPYSGFMKQVNPDPYLREINTWVDNLKVNFPGWSDTLDPVYDFMGQARTKQGTLVSRLSPAPSFEPSDDIIYQEIDRIGAVFAPPSKKRGNVNLLDFFDEKTGKNGYRLWNEIISTIKIGGKTLEEDLRELVTSKRFKEKGSTSYKDVVLGQSYRGTAEGMIRERLERYRERAFSEITRKGLRSKNGMLLEQALKHDRDNLRATARGLEVLKPLK